MLVEFEFGNFRSFKEIAKLSMVAAKIRAKNPELDRNNVFQLKDDLGLLKSVAIYGANASGKSNLIEAIGFMKRFVLNSSRDGVAREEINVQPFRLSTETIDKPSSFQVVFIDGETQYRYGFEVNRQQVVSEWLYHVPNEREVKLFERDATSIKPAREFREGKDLEDKTRSNALFLSVVAQFNGPISQAIVSWFRNLRVNSGLRDVGRSFTERLLQEPRTRDAIIRLVRRLDVGIDDIQIEEISPSPDIVENRLRVEGNRVFFSPRGPDRIIRTVHKKYDLEGKPTAEEHFNLDTEESEGTKKLFALAGYLLDILTQGKVLFVDELDARLHPLITRTVIQLFNSRESNRRNAQLIFVTHDTHLLSNDVFRRDQIWFAEKDRQGASHLYSLVEYRGVRNDASFERDYVQGRYGAIPFVGDLSAIMGELYDEAEA